MSRVVSSLVKVVQETDAPSSPSTWESFCEIHSRRDAGDGSTEPEKDSRNYKHCNILRGRLEDDTAESDDGAPEDGQASADPVREDASDQWTEEASDEDRRRVEPGGRRVQMEIIGVGRQDVESVEHGSIISSGLDSM